MHLYCSPMGSLLKVTLLKSYSLFGDGEVKVECPFIYFIFIFTSSQTKGVSTVVINGVS